MRETERSRHRRCPRCIAGQQIDGDDPQAQLRADPEPARVAKCGVSHVLEELVSHSPPSGPRNAAPSERPAPPGRELRGGHADAYSEHRRLVSDRHGGVRRPQRAAPKPRDCGGGMEVCRASRCLSARARHLTKRRAPSPPRAGTLTQAPEEQHRLRRFPRRQRATCGDGTMDASTMAAIYHERYEHADSIDPRGTARKPNAATR